MYIVLLESWTTQWLASIYILWFCGILSPFLGSSWYRLFLLSIIYYCFIEQTMEFNTSQRRRADLLENRLVIPGLSKR